MSMPQCEHWAQQVNSDRGCVGLSEGDFRSGRLSAKAEALPTPTPTVWS
jgi:hypothetical protein